MSTEPRPLAAGIERLLRSFRQGDREIADELARLDAHAG